MNLTTILAALQAVGPVVAQLPQFVAFYREVTALLSEDDQVVAKAALADIQAENDEGHARLQAKLIAASRRPS